MNQKGRFYLNVVVIIIFMTGVCAFLLKGDWSYAGAFLLAALAFGYRAVREKKREES